VIDEEDVMAELMKRDRPSHWPSWFTQGLPDWWRSLDLPDFEEWREREGMRLEEYQENGKLVVKAEMPGIDPEKDVEITVENGVLVISAQREEKREAGDEKKGFYRSEFRYGQFTRRLPLPEGASDEDVEATYADGILEVRLPIEERTSTVRKIPISSG
jgi:HSP20 family protein